MNLTWRFYIDQNRLWRWQRLTAGKAVVAESEAGCKDYEDCVKNAEARGYVFQLPRTSKTQARKTQERSYMLYRKSESRFRKNKR